MQIENQAIGKKYKAKTAGLRVLRETKKRVLGDLVNLNKKDFGHRITTDDYISLAISLVKPADLEQLKNQSISNGDRIEIAFQDYCKAVGKIEKDEFLGLLLDGKISMNEGSLK